MSNVTQVFTFILELLTNLSPQYVKLKNARGFEHRYKRTAVTYNHE